MASASAMRVGPWFEPLRKRRSPLTEQIHRRSSTRRSPVRTVRRWLSSSSAHASTTTSCIGCAPSDHGHHSCGCSIVTVHSTWFWPAANGCVSSWSTSPTDDRTVTVRPSTVSRFARSTTTARSDVASRHSTRSSRMRTGPVASSRTGRQIPPGFHSGSRQSQCWKTPVKFRFAVRSVCGAHVTSTASVCSVRCEVLGDVEGVGHEVPLGVAEVGAVEPHVALVEEPVEGEPRALGGATMGCSKFVR